MGHRAARREAQRDEGERGTRRVGRKDPRRVARSRLTTQYFHSAPETTTTARHGNRVVTLFELARGR
jgi:hypothetical protein